jgi:enoyl-CoA hydratase
VATGSSTSEALVGLQIADGVGWITLDDQPRRNSVTARLSSEVAAACARCIEHPEVRVVVLTGVGPTFSAGGDITSLLDPEAPLDVLFEGFDALATLAMPTLAAVNGPAIGAGVNFVLACDVVIAGRSARFDPRFLDVGIHPGGGHLWRMQRATSRQATAALVIFGESIDAQRAQELGLVWRCVDDDQLLDVAAALAARVAGRSPELVQRTKANLNASAAITDIRTAADLERGALEWSRRQPAFRKGVQALQAKLASGHR